MFCAIFHSFKWTAIKQTNQEWIYGGTEIHKMIIRKKNNHLDEDLLLRAVTTYVRWTVNQMQLLLWQLDQQLSRLRSSDEQNWYRILNIKHILASESKYKKMILKHIQESFRRLLLAIHEHDIKDENAYVNLQGQ